MPERGDDTIGDDRPEIMAARREGIEADRPFEIGRVDVDEIVVRACGDMVERSPGEVAMRIEQGEACARREILADEIEQQRALARAGLPDDVKMAAALLVARA